MEHCLNDERIGAFRRSLAAEEKARPTIEKYVRDLSRFAESVGEDRVITKDCVIAYKQTICSTGIRVSELQFVTVEALKKRRVEVVLKGKNRVVLLPSALCKELKHYAKRNDVKQGSIFVTRSGKPMDRSNIFRAMKALGRAAGVREEKVFPHNLRHLFACTYYKAEKDIAHLADILGHSSIETTRIYLMTSYEEQVKRIERLALVV